MLGGSEYGSNPMTPTPADVAGRAAARRRQREADAWAAAAAAEATVTDAVRRFARGGDGAMKDVAALIASSDAPGLVAFRACQLLAVALNVAPGGTELRESLLRRRRRRIRRR
ncbi:Uncharacterised protein [Mycobacteroides abscessus subsp. abscessus]|nr:Uncharacterised protein [Mycobacteroides abscessus subsp. abscessus]SHY44869.1 Uncharacterised protein [Mycobacteroides abscessus subsp. abscessus]